MLNSSRLITRIHTLPNNSPSLVFSPHFTQAHLITWANQTLFNNILQIISPISMIINNWFPSYWTPEICCRTLLKLIKTSGKIFKIWSWITLARMIRWYQTTWMIVICIERRMSRIFVIGLGFCPINEIKIV